AADARGGRDLCGTAGRGEKEPEVATARSHGGRPSCGAGPAGDAGGTGVGRARSAALAPSAGRELADDIRQNAAVAVVLRFDWNVQPDDHLELLCHAVL